jgi:hypothetical protein
MGTEEASENHIRVVTQGLENNDAPAKGVELIEGNGNSIEVRVKN